MVGRGADINAVDAHGTTPLHAMVICLRNTNRRDDDEDEVYNEESSRLFCNSELECIEENWFHWPVRFCSPKPLLVKALIRLLVFNGGNIYAENSKDHTPLSLVTDSALQCDMLYLTRKPLLNLLAVLYTCDDHKRSDPLHRLAENSDLRRAIVIFL